MITFQRSTRQVAATGFGLIGGTAFLAMAVLAGSGILGPELVIRIVGAVGFGSFGLLLGSGSVAALRQGSDPRVIEIGDDGVWLRGMGPLPWSEIAEVRLETTRGVGGARAAVTAPFRRLGVVPRDPAIRPDTATRVASLLSGGYYSFLRRLAPEIRVGGEAPAPFGVMEAEMPDRFDDLLVEVRRHVTVVDAIARRSRQRAPHLAAGPVAEGERREPADLSALDAAIGGMSPRSMTPTVPLAETAAPTSLASLVEAGATLPRSPTRTFSLPAITPLDLALACVPLIALIPIIGVVLTTIQSGGLTGIVWLVILGILLAVVVVPWLREMGRMIGRLRRGRVGIERLRIGPEGVWLAGADTRPWDRIREVRTERAGFVRRIGRPGIERWRLVFVPVGGAAAGPAPGVTSDQLDAPFDDVLDLIRSYHLVVETG